MDKKTEAVITYIGQVPPKSNFKYNRKSKASRAMWGRIKDFESYIGKLATEAGLKWARLAVKGRIEIRAWKQNVDPGNLDKPILDALEGVVFVNDRFVGTAADPEEPDNGPARVEILVTRGRMETVEEQREREQKALKRRMASKRRSKKVLGGKKK